MKLSPKLSLILIAVATLSACGQTSSISFKGNHTASSMPVAYAPGSGATNGGMMNVTTANGNKASLSIGSTINQVHLISSDGNQATLNVIGQTAN